MLDHVSGRVWTHTGDLPKTPMKRVSVIARRSDDTLVIHSANAGTEDEIARLGAVSYVVVPNGWHRLDAKRFAERFSNAKVICPAGSADKVGQVVKVDATYADYPDDANVSIVTLRGTKEREGVMIVRDDAGTTLVFTDSVFNMPHVPGAMGFVLRYITASSGGPKATRVAKNLLFSDKSAVAAHLRELARVPDLSRVIVAHHEPIDHAPREALEGIAASL